MATEHAPPNLNDLKTLWKCWDVIKLWDEDEQWSSDEIERVAEILLNWRGSKRPTPPEFRTLDEDQYPCSRCRGPMYEGVRRNQQGQPICLDCADEKQSSLSRPPNHR